MHKRNDSPFWWVNIKCPDGSRLRQSTGTEDKAEAEAIEGRLKAELWQQKVWGKTPDYTFDDIMAAYVTGRTNTKAYRSLCMSVKVLREYFGGMVLKTMRRDFIKNAMLQMQKDHNYRPGSVTTRMASFRAAVSYCKKELGWKVDDPTYGIKLPKKEGRIRWITVNEAERLISASKSLALGYVLSDFIVLALNTGMRKGEILHLTWQQVDIENQVIMLDANQNKSGRNRSVPLNESAIEALRRRHDFIDKNCPGSQWVMAKHDGIRLTSPNNAFTEACLKARIEDFKIHDLRHTCASWLVNAGVPIIDVREVLGHATVAMTEKYAHLSPDRAIKAVSMIGSSRFGHGKYFEDTLESLKATSGVGLKQIVRD